MTCPRSHRPVPSATDRRRRPLDSLRAQPHPCSALSLGRRLCPDCSGRLQLRSPRRAPSPRRARPAEAAAGCPGDAQPGPVGQRWGRRQPLNRRACRRRDWSGRSGLVAHRRSVPPTRCPGHPAAVAGGRRLARPGPVHRDGVRAGSLLPAVAGARPVWRGRQALWMRSIRARRRAPRGSADRVGLCEVLGVHRGWRVPRVGAFRV